jgi:RNA polymerase sigma-70 factor (ECF subfamily)
MLVSFVHERLVGMIRQERTVTALQERVSQLFEEARDDVYRYLLTLGLHPPQAQEAVQEVFLRLYAALKKGEEISSPRGWIFRVAHNYGLKVRERQILEEPFDPALETRLEAAGGNAEHQMILRMEGLRYPEIGSTLGISPSAVGEFLRRAMARLKKVRDE